MALAAPATLERWTDRRRRAGQLRERYPFADEVLDLYAPLLDVQERAFLAALEDRPDPTRLAAYVADRVLAAVVEATVAEGPAELAAASSEYAAMEEPAVLVSRWLASEDQPDVETYLARAAAGPVLEALGPAASAACSSPRESGRCPACGGRPQLSYLPAAEEALVTPPRFLLCCRCGESWVHERMACPGCGERSTARLSIYAESDRFPHVRVEACETCRRYLLAFDLRMDADAVPVVDELAALPLDLYVHERGFAKIVPNLMGIG